MHCNEHAVPTKPQMILELESVNVTHDISTSFRSNPIFLSHRWAYAQSSDFMPRKSEVFAAVASY